MKVHQTPGKRVLPKPFEMGIISWLFSLFSRFCPNTVKVFRCLCIKTQLLCYWAHCGLRLFQVQLPQKSQDCSAASGEFGLCFAVRDTT